MTDQLSTHSSQDCHVTFSAMTAGADSIGYSPLVAKGLLMIPAGRQCSFWSSDGVLGNRPVPPPALPISPDIAGVLVLPVLSVRSPAAATSCPSPMWNRTPSGGRLLLRPGRCPRHQPHEHLAELRHVHVHLRMHEWQV